MKKGMIVLVLLVALAVLPLAASAATPWHNGNGHNGNGHNNHWNNARHFSGHGNNQKIVFVQAPTVDCTDCSDDEYEYVTVGNTLYKVLKNPCTSTACDSGNGKLKLIKVA